jgi:dethiobiotin synthase
MSVIVVTGTDTDVGKTIATAALSAFVGSAGRSVFVYKPTQTGVVADEPGDIATVSRLAGVTGADGVRLRAAMAPRPAAALEDATLPVLSDHVSRIRALEPRYDVVLVEGAGGLLVELTEAGETIADLAAAVDAPVVVVVRSALGTLNHTRLTLEALQHRGIRVLGLVVGSWPETPSEVEKSNLTAFSDGRAALLGVIPAGVSGLSRDDFSEHAPGWLAGFPSARNMAP